MSRPFTAAEAYAAGVADYDLACSLHADEIDIAVRERCIASSLAAMYQNRIYRGEVEPLPNGVPSYA